MLSPEVTSGSSYLGRRIARSTSGSFRGAVTGGFGGGRQITDGVEVRCARLRTRDFFMAAPMFNYAIK
jgi:hypothetical protein